LIGGAKTKKGKDMETERIQQAIENSIIKMIQSGDAIKMNYDSKVDVSAEVRKAVCIGGAAIGGR
jgi:hypothetical protein